MLCNIPFWAFDHRNQLDAMVASSHALETRDGLRFGPNVRLHENWLRWQRNRRCLWTSCVCGSFALLLGTYWRIDIDTRLVSISPPAFDISRTSDATGRGSVPALALILPMHAILYILNLTARRLMQTCRLIHAHAFSCEDDSAIYPYLSWIFSTSDQKHDTQRCYFSKNDASLASLRNG